MRGITKKRLLVRLSSLGDIILADTARRQAELGGELCHDTWIVRSDLAFFFDAAPNAASSGLEVIPFSRREGTLGWMRLCWRLAARDFDLVIDLHNTTRSALLRAIFFLRRPGKHRFSVLSKERIRAWGQLVFKNLWPKPFAPTPMMSRFRKIFGVCVSDQKTRPFQNQDRLVLLAPASLWETKQWPTAFWIELASMFVEQKYKVGLIGLARDEAVAQFRNAATQTGLPLLPFLDLSISDLRSSFSRASALIGVDSAMAHLAQSESLPTVVVYGPTHEQGVFGVWTPTAKGVGAKLWCRPCGKTGQFCVQPNKQKCLKMVSAQMVWDAFTSLLETESPKATAPGPESVR